LKEINTSAITDQIRALCIQANERLPKDVANRLGTCYT